MSAPVLEVYGGSAIMHDDWLVLECVKLTPKWTERLMEFLQALEISGDAHFFFPHPATEEVINKLAGHRGRDLYYLLIEGENILGYGLLRGWDEGYEVPSLGIAIHPAARGRKLGEVLMRFLHALAIQRDAKKIRLRVRKENDAAIRLYKKFGYIFEDERNQDEYLTGFKSLTRKCDCDQ